MATYEKINKKAHYCVTCDFWKGERLCDQNYEYVIYNTFQREMCRGGGKSGEKTTPLMRCPYWRIWKQAQKRRASVLIDPGDEPSQGSALLEGLGGAYKPR